MSKYECKRVVVVVSGYVHHEVGSVASQWLTDVGAGSERYVYPTHSEGFVMHVISNQPILDEVDLVDATFGADLSDPIQLDTLTAIPTEGRVERYEGLNRGGEWYTAGTIHGYDEMGVDLYQV